MAGLVNFRAIIEPSLCQVFWKQDFLFANRKTILTYDYFDIVCLMEMLSFSLV